GQYRSGCTRRRLRNAGCKQDELQPEHCKTAIIAQGYRNAFAAGDSKTNPLAGSLWCNGNYFGHKLIIQAASYCFHNGRQCVCTRPNRYVGGNRKGTLQYCCKNTEIKCGQHHPESATGCNFRRYKSEGHWL